MPDLRTRLGSLDDVVAPDLWPDISVRTPRHEPEPEPSGARRLLISAVVLLIVAIGVGLPLKALLPLGDRDKPSPSAGVGGDTHLYAYLQQGGLLDRVMSMAAANGEPQPESVQAVVTTPNQVAALLNDVPAAHGPPARDVVFVQVVGSFTCHTCKQSTEAQITGKAMYVEANLGSGGITGWGITPEPLDLSNLGEPVDIPIPAPSPQSASASDSRWPPPPPITAEMLGIPKDWDGLTGKALADHLNLEEVRYDQPCNAGWTKTQGDMGWCVANAGPLTVAQTEALIVLLRGESFDDPLWQGRLAYALIQDAKKAGDDARAAELNWWYVERPRLLSNSDGGGPDGMPPAPVTPPAPGEDTYVFSNIGFTYPYVPDGMKGATPDEGFASLTFDSDWSGEVYPGEADCQARFQSADGSDVGGLTSGWAQATRHVAAREQVFPVTGVPARVSWACSAGVKPIDGVTLEGLHVEKRDDGLHVIATLRAPSAGETGPGTQVCEIRATAADGTPLSHGYSIDAPDGTHLDMRLPDTFDGATNLGSSCSPFTGQGG